MYQPPAFRETRVEVMHDLIRRYPLGLVVSAGPGGLMASPLPFLLDPGPEPWGTLRAHLARANPHAAQLAQAAECMVLFRGEQGYVSPAWYATKAATGQVVPTWDYAVVQARGAPRIVEQADWLTRQLEGLTAAQESQRQPAWSPGDAPEAFLRAQMAAIVGLEIPIADLEGKWKMSQNRSAEDRAGVIQGLAAPGDPHRHPRLAEEVAKRADPHSEEPYKQPLNKS
jgi:transcriptional regulator